MQENTLSESEISKIILAVIAYSGEATEDDIKKVIAWADNIRTGQAVLNLALTGKIALAPSDDPSDVLMRAL